jgi:putative transposase
MVGYIDQHRAEFGVEPICRTLEVAPSTYYAAKRREVSPSARAVRDAVMMQVLMTLWVANRKVYGADKLWKAARRAGHDIGRDATARLMRLMAIQGVSRRRRKVFTTRQDPDAVRAPDLVNRQFRADRPNALWTTDITYVPTRSGMAYVCFIVDAFSRTIVGWRVATHMRTDMVLDALEMARVSRGARRLVGLVTHSDAGSQFTSVRFTERLDEIGARPSIGTVADSFDNAMSESVNGLYKAECVYGPDANGWDDVDQLELETLSWVHWYNHDRLSHGARKLWRDVARSPRLTARATHLRGCRARRHAVTGAQPGLSGASPPGGDADPRRTTATATAMTCRPRSSKQRSTLPPSLPRQGLETNSPSLHQTQGGSDAAGSCCLGLMGWAAVTARRPKPMPRLAAMAARASSSGQAKG